MSSFDTVLGDTLAMVNVVREAFGYDALDELPDSNPGASQQCLYARALRDVGATGVSGGGTIGFQSERVAARVAELWGVEKSGSNVYAPGEFARVISKFDKGELPQYNLS